MITGFTFNNIHSSHHDICMRSIDRPIMPAVRKRELVVPNKHGTYGFGNEKYENKLIALKCHVDDTSLQDLRALGKEIGGWLKNKGELQFDDEPGKYYFGRVYNQISFEQEGRNGEFDLIFEVEPFAYSTTQFLEVTRTDDTSIFVTNSGTVETENIITITNTGTTPINGFKLKFIKNQ